MFDKPASASFDPLASFARTSRRLSGYIRTRIFQTSPVPTVQTSPNVVDDTIKAESAAIASEPGDAADFDRKRAVAYQNRHASMPAPTNVRPAVDERPSDDRCRLHAPAGRHPLAIDRQSRQEVSVQQCANERVSRQGRQDPCSEEQVERPLGKPASLDGAQGHGGQEARRHREGHDPFVDHAKKQ